MPRVSARRPHARHRPGDAAAVAGDVVEVHRRADHDVAVGVEAPAELGAVVLEVALDLELVADEVAAEALGEHVVAAERDLGHHPGHGQPLVGTVAGLGVVVVAAAVARVELDRPAADRPPRDLLRGRLHARGDRDHRADAVRVHDRPLEHLHPAHRAADDGVPPGDPEVVGEAGLGAHHVADRQHREPRPVRPAVDRVRRRRPGASPGSRRARSSTRRSSGWCRSAGPARPSTPTTRARDGRGRPGR